MDNNKKPSEPLEPERCRSRDDRHRLRDRVLFRQYHRRCGHWFAYHSVSFDV